MYHHPQRSGMRARHEVAIAEHICVVCFARGTMQRFVCSSEITPHLKGEHHPMHGCLPVWLHGEDCWAQTPAKHARHIQLLVTVQYTSQGICVA